MALIGVDWGTTSLRAYLINADGSLNSSLHASDAGTLAIHSKGPEHAHHFADALDKLLASGEHAAWKRKDVPVLLCGMVGSRQGWQEMPYVPTTSSTAAEVASAGHYVDMKDGRKALILPGLAHHPATGGARDVMRGEETQLLGALSVLAKSDKEAVKQRLFVLPGTHSKWAWTSAGAVTSFQTRMTGEVFDVLKKHSILGKLMQEGSSCHWEAFDAGLDRSASPGGLLNHLFTCRTEGLAETFLPEALPWYLSGMLLGHEIRDAVAGGQLFCPVTIVGNDLLCKRYQRAFSRVCGIEAATLSGDEAVINGFWQVWQEMRRWHHKEAAAVAKETWMQAIGSCPLVAILRGIKPDEALDVGKALLEAGCRIMEVPLNSPQAFSSIKLLADSVPADVVVGAGTVLTCEDVQKVADAGGTLVVSPNMDEAVIKRTKELGLLSVPGCATPTEAFAALRAGADAVKAFPGEQIPPKILKAWRAVLPKESLLMPTGGVTAENMHEYWDAGVDGFGVGSNLYKPGDTPAEVKRKADCLVNATRTLVPTSKVKRQKKSS